MQCREIAHTWPSHVRACLGAYHYLLPIMYSSLRKYVICCVQSALFCCRNGSVVIDSSLVFNHNKLEELLANITVTETTIAERFKKSYVSFFLDSKITISTGAYFRDTILLSAFNNHLINWCDYAVLNNKLINISINGSTI